MSDLPPPPPPPIPPPGWTPPRRRLPARWHKRIAIGIAIWMGLSLIAYAVDPPDDDTPPTTTTLR
jgi:hypothetical protein